MRSTIQLTGKLGLYQKSGLSRNPSELLDGRFVFVRQYRMAAEEALVKIMAEGGGFEPPVDLRLHNLSKVAPSTTRTPFQAEKVRIV